MFARHGIQNALRTRRRSVAFLLLMTLLVTLLGTSLGLSFALQETLRQCRENYSTIGLVEYLGPGYPSTARVVEDAGEVLEEFESKLDRSDPALVDWEPTRVALGYTPALESLTDYSVLENRFALVIRLTEQATRRIKGQDPDFYPLLDPDGQLVWQWGTGTPDREVKLPYYYANVVETLFSSQRLAANQPVLLDVQEGSSADLSQDYNMPSDTIWKARHYYLVQGVYTENELLGPSYKQLSPAPYQVNGVSLSQVSAIDITRPDGSCAQLDGSTDIEAVGQTFQVTSHSLTAQATDRPADLLPFQQDELTLVQGDYYAAGSKGCLISQTLADDLGLDVGGSLPLSLAVREDTLVPYSYWNSQGFDAQDTYTVSGIFSANEEYDSMVYIPVREDVDMTVNHCSYTLGQLQIRNGQAQAYVERLQQQLPGSIQITVYDQGYTAVSQSLEDMLRMVQIIAGVCLAVGLGFLVLFGYLLVYRQRGVGRTMIRVGAARRNVHTYFLFCAGTVALPAAVLGWILSRCVGLGVLKLLELMLENGASAELYFSNTALAMQRTATEYLAAPGWGILALIALATIIIFNIWGKGMFKIIPILMGVVVSYIAALIMNACGVTVLNAAGEAIPLIDFTAVREASILGLPPFQMAKFDLTAILVMAPIALATMMEHIGDMSAISATVGQNFIQEPGLHRTLVGDGIATSLAGMFGGPANTTYGENTGVLVLSKVHDPRVIRLAAVYAIVLSFIPKMADIIGSMPSAIVGGVSFILYGMISAIGVRNIVENNVDLTKSRNLIIAAVILVCGLGFSSGITFTVAGTSITLTGLAIAALAGILLNAILPGNDYEFGVNPEGDQNRGIHQ